MRYRVETTPRFDKEFKKLDRYTRMIKLWIEKNLVIVKIQGNTGKGLTSDCSGQRRYRIGDYRLICKIKDNELIILALSINHRREIYTSEKRTSQQRTFSYWLVFIEKVLKCAVGLNVVLNLV